MDLSGVSQGLQGGLGLGLQGMQLQENREYRQQVLGQQKERQQLEVYMKGLEEVSKNPAAAQAVDQMFQRVGLGPLDPGIVQMGQRTETAVAALGQAYARGTIDGIPPDVLGDVTRVAGKQAHLAQMWKALVDRSLDEESRGQFVANYKALRESGKPDHEAFSQALLTTRGALDINKIKEARPVQPSFAEAQGLQQQPQINAILGALQSRQIDPPTAAAKLAELGPAGMAVIEKYPALSAHTSGLRAGAMEKGRLGVLAEPVEGVNLSDVAPYSARPGAPVDAATWGGAGAGQESGTMLPPGAPGRTYGDLKAEQMGREAQARVTDVDRQRLGYEGQRVGYEGQRVANEQTRLGYEGQRVDISRQEHERRATKDRELKERVGATLKTMEADAIARADQVFPTAGGDPTMIAKNRAFKEWLLTRTRNLNSMLASDRPPEEIEKEIAGAISRLNGELPDDLAEAKPAAEGWLTRAWRTITGGGAKPAAPAPAASAPAAPAAAAGPITPRRLPGRPAPAAPPPAAQGGQQAPADALRAAATAIAGALFPGRSWNQLTVAEKQQVTDRLNGRHE